MLRRTAAVLVLLPWALGLFSSTASAATITVTTTTDEFDVPANATCSLREAIHAANGGGSFGGCTGGTGGADTVQLAAQTYQITRLNTPDPMMEEDANVTGDLDISSDLLIQGPPGGQATIDANGTTGMDRALELTGDDLLTLRRIKVQEGNALGDGGAVLADDGTLTIQDSVISSSRAGARGGGVAGRNVSLIRTTVVSNTANRGGGIATVTGGGDQIELIDSIVDSNTGTTGGGGIFSGGSGALSLQRALVTDNDTNGQGGGIASQPTASGASLTIRNSMIVSNEADEENNNLGNGGGIFLDAGSEPAPTLITGSTINGNLAENGDGLFNDSAVVTVTNSTVTGNGGIGKGGLGGGLYVDGGTTSLNNVTFDANTSSTTASTGGNLYSSGTVNLRNTLIGVHVAGGNCAGPTPLTDQGNTIEETAGGAGTCVPTLVADAGLADPADNGGPLLPETIGAPLTQALQPNSPAIGAGSGCPSTDQRGVPRPQGGGCDVGAYEVAMCLGRRADDPVGVPAGANARTGTGGADVLFGLGGPDALRGLGGNDRLCGIGGRDRLVAGAGADRMDGGPQSDVCLGGPGRDRARACERVTGVP